MPELPVIPGYTHIAGPFASLYGTDGYLVYEAPANAPAPAIPPGYEAWPLDGNKPLIIRPRKAPPPPPEPPKPTDGVVVASGGDVTAALRAAQPGTKVYLERGGTYAPILDTTLRPNGVTLAAWGTGPRPRIDCGSGTGLKLWTVDGFTVDGIAVVGDGKPADDAAGINVMGCQKIVIRSCEVAGSRMGVTIQPAGNRRSAGATIDRCWIHDNAPRGDGADGSGIFAGATDALVIDGNVIDRNGWSDTYRGSMRNHGCYVRGDCGPATIVGNIFARASSHGLQARSGGIVAQNLFYENPIGMSFGLVNGGGPIVPGGVTGEVRENVFAGVRNMAGKPMGWGLEISNAADVVVTSNTFGSDAPVNPQAGNRPAAIKLDVCDLSDDHPQRNKAVGVKKILIANNAIAWPYARLWVNPRLGITVVEQGAKPADVAAVKATAAQRYAAAVREAAK